MEHVVHFGCMGGEKMGKGVSGMVKGGCVKVRDVVHIEAEPKGCLCKACDSPTGELPAGEGLGKGRVWNEQGWGEGGRGVQWM